eukprot:8225894-Karenia_brevis.AAC.1
MGGTALLVKVWLHSTSRDGGALTSLGPASPKKDGGRVELFGSAPLPQLPTRFLKCSGRAFAAKSEARLSTGERFCSANINRPCFL